MSLKRLVYGASSFIIKLYMLFGVFILLFAGWGLSWWKAALIDAAVVFVWQLPGLNLLSPVPYAIYLLIGTIVMFQRPGSWGIVLLVLLILHCFLVWGMIRFERENPDDIEVMPRRY